MPRLLGWSVVTLGMGIGLIVAAFFVGEYTPQLAYWGGALLLFGTISGLGASGSPGALNS